MLTAMTEEDWTIVLQVFDASRSRAIQRHSQHALTSTISQVFGVNDVRKLYSVSGYIHERDMLIARELRRIIEDGVAELLAVVPGDGYRGQPWEDK